MCYPVSIIISSSTAYESEDMMNTELLMLAFLLVSLAATYRVESILAVNHTRR